VTASPLTFNFLGSGNAFCPPGRWWNGFLVNDRWLFDAPPSVLGQLNNLRMDTSDVEVLFISHRHADHFLGLPFLLMDWAYRSARTRDLTIVCPPDTKERLQEVMDIVLPGLLKREMPFKTHWKYARQGSEGEVNGLRYQAFEMQHVPAVGLCLGFRLEAGGRAFAYTGDTALCDSVFALAEGVEVLVSECASQADEMAIHMNMANIRELRERIDERTHILLTHLSEDVVADGLPNASLAYDLGVFRFDEHLLNPRG
jgi:ribonuclease BN (tRNA processing enzyme)